MTRNHTTSPRDALRIALGVAGALAGVAIIVILLAVLIHLTESSAPIFDAEEPEGYRTDAFPGEARLPGGGIRGRVAGAEASSPVTRPMPRASPGSIPPWPVPRSSSAPRPG